jgi:NADP-dependent 3-hydroxy acid dehydrogenase YdfG
MSKTILITGTSNGFGKDAAKTLSEAGHQPIQAQLINGIGFDKLQKLYVQ